MSDSANQFRAGFVSAIAGICYVLDKGDIVLEELLKGLGVINWSEIYSKDIAVLKKYGIDIEKFGYKGEKGKSE